MAFYFFAHLLLGLIASNSSVLYAQAYDRPFLFPRWMSGSVWMPLGSGLSLLIAVLTIPTTFVQWGFLWSLATVIELILGLFAIVLIPLNLRILLAAVGPIISVALIGALWGFWRI